MDALELVNVRQMTDAHGRAIIVKSIAAKIENGKIRPSMLRPIALRTI